MPEPISLSIVLPVFNEAENLPSLHEKLTQVLTALDRSWEILFIDDGSQDGSPDILGRLAAADPRTKAIFFRKNYGQTAALAAGFRHAQGEVVVAMDADLQNDPEDIPMFLKKIEEGYDVVSGWRKDRQDPWLSRKVPSYIANKIISRVSGVRLRDYGCTLRAYKRIYLKDIHLMGEMHRFIPIYASRLGARMTEIPVTHHPRLRGKSKYGLWRTFKVLLDLITLKFLGDFSTKPIYVFGGIGFASIFLGGLASGFVLVQKIFFGVWVHRNPVLAISIFFLMLGFQFILMGVLAEIMIRVYHESSSRPTYWIRGTVNLDEIYSQGARTSE